MNSQTPFEVPPNVSMSFRAKESGSESCFTLSYVSLISFILEYFLNLSWFSWIWQLWKLQLFVDYASIEFARCFLWLDPGYASLTEMSQKWCCVLIASYSHGMWSDLAHDWYCSFLITYSGSVCLASLLQQYSLFYLIIQAFCRQILSKYLTYWISNYSFIYVLAYVYMDSWFHFNSMLKLTQL